MIRKLKTWRFWICFQILYTANLYWVTRSQIIATSRVKSYSDQNCQAKFLGYRFYKFVVFNVVRKLKTWGFWICFQKFSKIKSDRETTVLRSRPKVTVTKFSHWPKIWDSLHIIFWFLYCKTAEDVRILKMVSKFRNFEKAESYSDQKLQCP